MCRWTMVRPGTWPSCRLLVTSSFTPSWQRTTKWSSCMLTSQEVRNLTCNAKKPFPKPFLYSVCVNHFCGVFSTSTDTGFGTIYVSDDRGTVYSKSLERHLYTTTGGDTDFTNATSLRGVFITSVLAEGSSIHVPVFR